MSYFVETSALTSVPAGESTSGMHWPLHVGHAEQLLHESADQKQRGQGWQWSAYVIIWVCACAAVCVHMRIWLCICSRICVHMNVCVLSFRTLSVFRKHQMSESLQERWPASACMGDIEQMISINKTFNNTNMYRYWRENTHSNNTDDE